MCQQDYMRFKKFHKCKTQIILDRPKFPHFDTEIQYMQGKNYWLSKFQRF